MVYGKELYAGFHQEYSLLQKSEIKKGMDDGLTIQEVEKYASPAYNFMQMKEIRTAIEEKIPEKEYAVMCDPAISAEEMKEMRIRLAHGQIVRRHGTVWRMAVGSVCVLGLVGYLGYAMFAPKQMPELTLSSQEITLSVGEQFEPMYYIQNYNGEDGQLILPEFVSTGTAGRKAAVYRLLTKDTELVRILYVNVKETHEKKE